MLKSNDFKKNWTIIFILVFSLLLRLIGLNSVPHGVSPEEAKFGTFLSSFFGVKVTSLFLIRLPFVILGAASIYLFYKFLKKLRKNTYLPFLGSVLIVITPWHIRESRTFSWGMLVFVFILFLLVRYFSFLTKNIKRVVLFTVIISASLFSLSILKNLNVVGDEVNYQRSISSRKLPLVVTKLFSNKYVESYRYKEKLFFEQFDIGNYFFSGYPRSRWGVEEYQKFFLIFLPFLLYGIKESKKNRLLLIGSIFVSYALILSAFELRDPTWGLPYVALFAYLIARGIQRSWPILKNTRLKIIPLVMIFFFVIEGLYFGFVYVNGMGESQFSKHSTVYKELTRDVLNFSKNYDNVFVTTRLDNAKIYFEFYAPEEKEKYVYRDFNLIYDSSPKTLYVEIFPFDPSPVEQLYQGSGDWPEYVSVYSVIKDTKNQFDVVVFSSKL